MSIIRVDTAAVAVPATATPTAYRGHLLVFTGYHPHYEYGDVVAAFNWWSMRFTHAWHICHHNLVTRNSDEMLPSNSMPRWIREYTHQWRFERVNKWVYRRIEIATGAWEMFGREVGDLPLWIHRRMQHRHPETGHPLNLIFGRPGQEMWFSGHEDYSHANLDLVWAAIEQRTHHRQKNYNWWPFQKGDTNSCKIIDVDDFDNETSARLTAKVIDKSNPDNWVTVSKTSHRVRPEIIQEAVRGRRYKVDEIVEVKV